MVNLFFTILLVLEGKTYLSEIKFKTLNGQQYDQGRMLNIIVQSDLHCYL